jgi:uncharacterized membrane protein YccC
MNNRASAVIAQTLRILVASAASYVAAWAIGLQEGYWAIITAVVVLQPAFADTLNASRNRVLGTIVGALAGLCVLEAVQYGGSRFWLFWCALVPLAALTAAWPNLRLSCVTLVVVVLLPATGAPFLRAFDRILAILLGTLASIAVSVTLPKSWWRPFSKPRSGP